MNSKISIALMVFLTIFALAVYSIAIDAPREARLLATQTPVTAPVARGAGDSNFTNLVASGLFRATPKSAQTVTAGGNILMNASVVQLSAAGTVGTSDLTAGTAGDIVTLVNTAAQTITITDTGTIMLAGNVALAQYDALTVYFDGTNWIEIGASNN